jgi:hypothetical protein
VSELSIPLAATHPPAWVVIEIRSPTSEPPLSPKFAAATRGKPNLLNHLRRNSLVKSIHVIGRADVHKSSNL